MQKNGKLFLPVWQSVQRVKFDDQGSIHVSHITLCTVGPKVSKKYLKYYNHLVQYHHSKNGEFWPTVHYIIWSQCALCMLQTQILYVWHHHDAVRK